MASRARRSKPASDPEHRPPTALSQNAKSRQKQHSPLIRQLREKCHAAKSSWRFFRVTIEAAESGPGFRIVRRCVDERGHLRNYFVDHETRVARFAWIARRLARHVRRVERRQFRIR